MEGFVEPGLRLLHYAVLLGLFGGAAFRLIGLGKLDRVPQDWPNAVLAGAVMAAPLLSLALMLASIAAMMGVPATALDWPMVAAMVLGTDMGSAFLVRAVLLITGMFALLARHRTKTALPIAVACFAGALMTLGWSGHAAATDGGIGLIHRANNGVHLLAAGLWLGAIGWFLHLTAKAHRQPDLALARPLLGVMHRFAPLGVGLVATVALTGLINAQLIFGLENGGTVLATGYGMLLAAKIAAVAGMLGFAARNARVARRNAGSEDGSANAPEVMLSMLRRSLSAEFALGVCVIGLVAILGLMSPMPM